jgi:hypothetical protein
MCTRGRESEISRKRSPITPWILVPFFCTGCKGAQTQMPKGVEMRAQHLNARTEGHTTGYSASISRMDAAVRINADTNDSATALSSRSGPSSSGNSPHSPNTSPFLTIRSPAARPTAPRFKPTLPPPCARWEPLSALSVGAEGLGPAFTKTAPSTTRNISSPRWPYSNITSLFAKAAWRRREATKPRHLSSNPCRDFKHPLNLRVRLQVLRGNHHSTASGFPMLCWQWMDSRLAQQRESIRTLGHNVCLLCRFARTSLVGPALPQPSRFQPAAPAQDTILTAQHPLNFSALQGAHTCRIGSCGRICAPTCSRILARSGPCTSRSRPSSSNRLGDCRQHNAKKLRTYMNR